MKQKIRLMAMLWPVGRLSASFRKYKRKQLSDKLSRISCVQTPAKAPARSGLSLALGIMACLLFTLIAKLHAQDSIKPLQIGDAIPEYLWHMPLQVVNHPEGRETIMLADYKGKLIILDFWGTFCGSCIGAMPKIHEVQKQFDGDMVVLPVSWSKPEATEETLKNHEKLKLLQLPSVVNAKQLIDVFPHGVVPHYAWIDQKGRVVATTATNDVSSDNIAKVLQGEKPDYALITYIDMDKPLLFQMENLPNGAELQRYSVFIGGSMPSLIAGTRFRKSGDIVCGMALFNKSLFDMYLSIARQTRREPLGKRFKLVDRIEDEGSYTLDFIVPIEKADSLFAEMLDYLNRYTGYNGQWVIRKQRCLSLFTISGSNQFINKIPKKSIEQDKHNYKAHGYNINKFVTWLNTPEISGELIVLNETGYHGLVDITLGGPFDDMDNVRKQLNKQGLDLVEVYRDVELFEIRKSPSQRR